MQVKTPFLRKISEESNKSAIYDLIIQQLIVVVNNYF